MDDDSHKVPIVDEEMLMPVDVGQEESAPGWDEPPIAMYMEEVEIDEKNPEDSWYDPSVSDLQSEKVLALKFCASEALLCREKKYFF